MKNLIKYFYIILIGLSGCTTMPTQQPAPKPSDTPIPHVDCDAGWQDAYGNYIANHLPAELSQISPAKMASICPNYSKIDQTQAWVNIIRAVIYAESGYNRCSWMTETTMDTDPVTDAQVKSEGLLQLSYQDVENYSAAKGCGIDWSKDKGKKVDDPTKTIFDATINLRCGLAIMAQSLDWYPSKDFQDAVGTYWYTLQKKEGRDCDAKGKLAELFPACGVRACE